MPGRNLAKPFAIAGFILAEIYMLFTVLAPPAREAGRLPLAIPHPAPRTAHATPPIRAQVARVAISAIFFGPFGAIAGTGLGLLVSGLRGDFRKGPRPPENGGSGNQPTGS